MPAADDSGSGTPDDPWTLYTPSLRSRFEIYRNESADPPALEAFGLAEVEHSARRNRMRAS